MATLVEILFNVKFNMNADPPTLVFTDLVGNDYDDIYGCLLSDVKGLLKIQGPTGVLYKNTGYDADDFSSPDTEGGTPTWSKTMNLPLDTNDKVEQGNYQINYKVSIDNGASVNNTKTYTFDLDYTAPSSSMSFTINILASTLSYSDDTDYALNYKGSDYDPITDVDTTRSVTISYDKRAGTPPGSLADETFTTETGTVGPNIWEGVYVIQVSTDVEYTVVSNADGSALVSITDSIYGTYSETVQKDDCYCQIWSCLTNLDSSYLTAIQSGDQKEAFRILKQINLVTFYMTMYKAAIECGEDTNVYCQKIKEIALLENCTCTDSTATITEIIPVTTSTGSGGTVGSRIYFTVGTPAGGLGNNYDTAIDSNNGNVYYKESGSWTLKGTFQGADGADGSAGTTLLTNDKTAVGTPANTSEYTLKTIVIPANTLDSDYEMLRIRADFVLSTDPGSRIIRFKWGATAYLEYEMDYTVVADNQLVSLEVEITRTGASAQYISGKIMHFNTDNPYPKAVNTTASLDLTSAQNVVVTGQNGVATAGLITIKSISIEKLIA